ncbi:MAG: riboflavin synthase subunit alpha [Deltaproteobacteria bacterium RBG_19FT_COMBO_46_9]|nr:MAG: riboflavin synthase subunit alpha [Deltaproteobacteria bacterium RBG_19FT_COMBO_46_9]
MFTGLIEGIGKIQSVTKTGRDMNLTIVPLFDMADSKIGDSISVDGVCLTITAIKDKVLSMYASEETVSRSTMGRLRQGDEVNLERALSLSGRLGGHMVSGHVDGVGRIIRKEQVQRSWLIKINIDKGMSRYVIEKGSIAVDGISLTVNTCKDDFFEVNIIPETAIITTILKKNIGDPVNIEMDLIAKYVEKFFMRDRESVKDTASGHISKEMLERYGFGE